MARVWFVWTAALASTLPALASAQLLGIDNDSGDGTSSLHVRGGGRHPEAGGGSSTPPLAARAPGSAELHARPLPDDAPQSWQRNYGCIGDFATMPWCDLSLGIDARVSLLINSMSLEEMASQLQARASPPIERLGVPFFCFVGQNIQRQTASFNDWVPRGGKHGGVGSDEQDDAVHLQAVHWSFPRPMGLGATWNVSAMRQYGAILALAARVKFNNASPDQTVAYGHDCPGSVSNRSLPLFRTKTTSQSSRSLISLNPPPSMLLHPSNDVHASY